LKKEEESNWCRNGCWMEFADVVLVRGNQKDVVDLMDLYKNCSFKDSVFY